MECPKWKRNHRHGALGYLPGRIHRRSLGAWSWSRGRSSWRGFTASSRMHGQDAGARSSRGVRQGPARPCESRCFSPPVAGTLRVPVGASCGLLRDERGMRSLS